MPLMKRYDNFSEASKSHKPRAIAIGVFDGLHLGHRAILQACLRYARKMGYQASVLTFHPHPRHMVGGPRERLRMIHSPEHRLKIIESMGFDEAILLKFNRRLANIPAEVFLQKHLLQQLGMKAIFIGNDFRFGKSAKGDIRFLRKAAKINRFHLGLVPSKTYRGEIISSTLIRKEIELGNLVKASKMLGRPVSVYGNVVHGSGRGHLLGFPTANIDPHHEALPPSGVYAVRGLYQGRYLPGVLHLGPRPTFHERKPTLEAYFMNFHRNIYGRNIEIIFVDYLRPILRFERPQDLVQAIRKDVIAAGKAIRIFKKII